MLNVLTFGADPTGVNDSSAAFQLALNQAIWKDKIDSNAYVMSSTMPEVFVPTGIYRIDKTLNAMPHLLLTGENAILIGTMGNGSFIINANGATDVHIRGIRLMSYTLANGISITNPNINATRIWIESCDFDRLRLGVYTSGTGDPSGQMSARMHIDNCRFRECGTTISTKCDTTHVSNCWIQWSKLYANAFCIENNRGAMSLDHVLFVPEGFTVYPTTNWWIKNSGLSFTATNRTRFGGEDGGLPIIFQNASPINPSTNLGTTIMLDNCQCSAGVQSTTNTASAVITLTSNCPQMITVRGCDSMFAVPQIIDPANGGALFAATMKVPPKFRFEGNVAWPKDGNVPASLAKYTVVYP